MKKNLTLTIIMLFLLIGCSPHFHLDFLGEDQLQEVVLIKSKAKEKILILDISGIIGISSPPSILDREGNFLSRIYYRLQKAAEDKMIKGVILRLDTPGGEVTASDILYNEILEFKKETGIPVLALMMGITASGGYYIASACDSIIAHPSTITGSIGVISIFPNIEELLKKIGVKVNIIKSGSMKDSGSSFRKLTSNERIVFQDVVNEFYERFLEVVYKRRQNYFSLQELKKIADGRIYTASQAYELKLIDEIGYFDTAMKKMLSEAHLHEATVVTYTYYPKTKTNIYAASMKKTSLFEEKDYTKIFQSLKSGFYYLWLPQLTN